MLKVCFIGSSGHYRYALDGFRFIPDASAVAVAPGCEGEDVDAAIARISNAGQSPRKYEDYREMLDREKPDVAVINTYFAFNAGIAVEALERGINVFVEKPVGTTFEDLERVRTALAASGKKLAAMLGLRYAPHFYTAWKAVREGAVGEVRLMTAQKSYRLGERGPNYRKREIYGGTIPWVGSHAIDWLYWFGNKRFKSVMASHSRCCNRGHGDLEMTAVCHFTFEDEVLGAVNIDYLRPSTAPSHDDDRARIAGTSGVIEVRTNKVYLIGEQRSGVQELAVDNPGSIFADFVAEIRGEGKCLVSAEDSLYVTEACLRARESADTGRLVTF